MAKTTRKTAFRTPTNPGRTVPHRKRQPTHHAQPPALPGPRAGSKTAQLLAALSAPEGCAIAQLSKTLGWQPHSTRAALTRLRQAGHRLERLSATGATPSRYRLKAPAR